MYIIVCVYSYQSYVYIYIYYSSIPGSSKYVKCLPFVYCICFLVEKAHAFYTILEDPGIFISCPSCVISTCQHIGEKHRSPTAIQPVAGAHHLGDNSLFK